MIRGAEICPRITITKITISEKEMHLQKEQECGEMTYVHDYSSPVGKILLAANEDSLTGLWFYGAKYFAAGLESERTEMLTPVLEQTMQWLDVYFSGSEPDFVPPLEMHGSAFQRSVWAELMKIPYGQTSSYGEIALRLGVNSAQTIGGAVGHNPISIIVPCHRVLGADGSLTGYAAGVDKKMRLLELESAREV